MPFTLLIIFVLLYLTFKRFDEALLILATLPFALIGGFWLLYGLGYNLSVAGAIGFVGLVVPHALRLVIGNDQRLLLPASVFGGGIALVGADMVARTVLAPIQLPVGVATAMMGVPVFLYLLNRGRT